MVRKYSDLYLDARRQLAPSMGEQAGSAARQLLAAASGKTVEQIIASRDIYASEQIEQTLTRLIERAASGEPLAYVLGEWDFYGMTLQVTPDVLIPRDDTVAVTELAVQHCVPLRTEPRILDLCAGSGCIGLAIARRIHDARVVLGELSPQALRVAKNNVAAQKLGGRVTCMPLDVRKRASHFLGIFDLIVSNPPYVTTQQMAQLPPSVRDYEPTLALHGGEDGLDFYRAIVDNFTEVLRPGGTMCFEFGLGQHEQVGRILTQAGYRIVEWKQDSMKIIRAVCAEKEKDE